MYLAALVTKLLLLSLESDKDRQQKLESISKKIMPTKTAPMGVILLSIIKSRVCMLSIGSWFNIVNS